MAKSEIHVGQIIRLIARFVEDESPKDVSAATTIEIRLEKPDGTVLTKTAGFVSDGTDGKIFYDTLSTDLDVDGGWAIQGYAVGPTYIWPSEIKGFHVFPNLT